LSRIIDRGSGTQLVELLAVEALHRSGPNSIGIEPAASLPAEKDVVRGSGGDCGVERGSVTVEFQSSGLFADPARSCRKIDETGRGETTTQTARARNPRITIRQRRNAGYERDAIRAGAVAGQAQPKMHGAKAGILVRFALPRRRSLRASHSAGRGRRQPRGGRKRR
jgi:hypothetical protein